MCILWSDLSGQFSTLPRKGIELAMLLLEDRLFPADASTRKIARALYAQVRSLPIISPHGHTPAGWFATNEPFPDPAKLLVQPDHYVFRMLYSQGVSLDSLDDHKAIRASGWKARIVPAFRPDPVVDPEFAGFSQSILKLGENTGEDCSTWKGYPNALRKAPLRFKTLGCTSTDHGHLTAQTADLPTNEAAELFCRVLAGNADA